VITIWNVVLGIAVMLWAFGPGQVKTMLTRRGGRRGRRAPVDGPPSRAEDAAS
jgi:hypothetical protein